MLTICHYIPILCLFYTLTRSTLSLSLYRKCPYIFFFLLVRISVILILLCAFRFRCWKLVFIPNELPQREEIRKTKDRHRTCPESLETLSRVSFLFLLSKLKKKNVFFFPPNRFYFLLKITFPSTVPLHIEHFSLLQIFSVGHCRRLCPTGDNL
jgi:hypothetical protein